MRTHENMILLIANDLGEGRAAMLVTDALTGGDAAMLRLQRLAGVHASRSACEKDVLVISKRLPDGAVWCGGTLILGDALPDSLGLAIVGLPLGQVVSGSGRDDAVVEAARTHARIPTEDDGRARAVTSIDVESRMVGADEIPTTRAALRMRRLRMLAARTHLVWHGQREERFDMRVRDPLPECVLMIMLLAVFLAMMPILYAMIFLVETRDGARFARRRLRGDAGAIPATI